MNPTNAHSMIREGALWKVQYSIFLFIRALAFIKKNMEPIFHNHRSPAGDPQLNPISRNRQMGQLRHLDSRAYDS